MFDLTGGALAGYLLRVTRDVVNRNPRFRRTLGDAAIATSNQLSYGDVQVIVKDVSSEGNRLSPDYFICTQTGQAIATQVADKLGMFLEWATETDTSGTILDPGVYYLNVNWVKESIQPDPQIPPEAAIGDISFTIGKFKWRQGKLIGAAGTRVAFRAGIDATSVTPYDGQTDVPLTFQAGANYLFILSPAATLAVKDAGGNLLVPNVDFWLERTTSQLLIQTTVAGFQDVDIPASYLTVAVIDQDGYTLRPDLDYSFTSATRIRLAGWTPAGSTLTLEGLVKVDPTVSGSVVNPENVLAIQLLPGEKIVANQAFISTQDADHIQLTVNSDGTVSLPFPLPPGGWCTYEVRIDAGETTVLGKRNQINKNLIPGLWLAIGDQVTKNDQAAVIVSPTICETYEVYGSKENVHATIDIKANDLMTASTLSEMLKEYLLIRGADRLHADGVALFEASRSYVGQQRDGSGTAPTFTYSVSIAAAADWRVFVPLVTRVTSFNIIPNPNLGDFPGKLANSSLYKAFGVTGFQPDYR